MYPLQVLFAQLVQHGKNGLLDYFIHGRILLSVDDYITLSSVCVVLRYDFQYSGNKFLVAVFYAPE